MTQTLELPVPGPAVAPPLLELRGVKAAYEQVEVLHGIDLAVPAGTVVAVLGPNGAGKTTMLKVASGMHPPTAGELWLAGRNVTGAAPVELARLGLCSIPEGRGVFPNLTVSENLWMASYRGVSRADIEERVFPIFPRLKQRRRQAAGTMSGGEQQMLAMARAIATDPAVLLIDELSMGLAPLVVEQLFEIVARIAGTGVTVLLVEQFAKTALGVADLAAVMTGGRITAVGTPDAIASRLHSAYLGGGDEPQGEPTMTGTPSDPRDPAAQADPSEPDHSTVVLPVGADRYTAYLGGEQAPPAPENDGETRGEPMSTNTAGVPPTVPAGTPVPFPEQPPAPPAGSRSHALTQEVAGLRVKTPTTTMDTQLMWLGVLLMVGGIGTGIGAYIMSHTTTLYLTQYDAIVAGLLGVTISIAGMALFVRYSLSSFLRFWLARLIAAQQGVGPGGPGGGVPPSA
ncbi:ABC transporter ATP-binding protein [Yinghuangia seranimata]|uniref:ABC transporter ATP-binding protein n=1 Tax=Yinghuangia seranimata TaxID=408067 RepID=UPI00248C0966|nr:ABC transporter ATP-binding protein [Yinghuangia seranimata]MDI2131598.1 ABC transporter ATP-binding protein [Yinghuangia seranimata]